MKKMTLFVCLLPMVTFAQSSSEQGADPLKVIGVAPFSLEESETMYAEAARLMGKEAECWQKYSGTMPEGNIQETCAGRMLDATTQDMRTAVKSFMSTYGDEKYGSNGDAVSATQSFLPASMKKPNTKGSGFYREGISELMQKNIKCIVKRPEGQYTEKASNIEGFINAHMRHIMVENGIYQLDKSGQAPYRELQKIGAQACKNFKKEVGNGNVTKYTPGFGGYNVVVYSKEVNSVAEAIPYMIMSDQKMKLASQDLKQSNFGSSDRGSDQLMNEISLPPYYDGNRGKNMIFGTSPLKKFQGENEGANGSAGIIAWQLCVQEEGPKRSYLPGSDNPPTSQGEGYGNFELGNHNTTVFMPNNIISPFPLVVKDGKIDVDNTQIDYQVNEDDGSVKINTDAPQYAYGPRNSELSPKEKQQMQDAASAMRLKVNGFINNIFDDPTQSLNLSNTSLNVMSCSNRITNQRGYANWDTEGNLKEQDGDKRVSFEELSHLRSEAKAIIAKKMIIKELDAEKEKVDQEIKGLKSKLLILDARSEDYSVVENRMKYLEDKLSKMNKASFNQLNVNIIACNEDGAAGPEPNFSKLKAMYDPRAKFPQKENFSTQSGYFTELQNISYNLKKKDIETKLKKTQDKLDKLGPAEADDILRDRYTSWIKEYKDILSGKDGKPGYLNTPVMGIYPKSYGTKFPCDMQSNPGGSLDCNTVTHTNELLNKFKVESVALDIDLTKGNPDEKIINGYQNKPNKVVIPGSGKIYYAAIMCNRKYNAPKTKKGKCISQSTGWVIDCETGRPISSGSKGVHR